MYNYQKYDHDLTKSHGGIRANISTLTESYPLHQHDHTELEIVVEGHGIHCLNGQSFAVCPGDFWGLGTEDMHKVDIDKPLVIYSMKFSESEVSHVISELIEPAGLPFTGHLEGEPFGRALQGFRNIFDTAGERTEFQTARSTGFALVIISEFLENSSALKPPTEKSPALNYVRRAISFMRGNFREPLTLTRAAAEIGVSPCYLSDIFSRNAGRGFTAYLNRLRAENARRLLVTTDISVTQIAFESGFGSVSSMNRCFLREFGLSPRDLRNRGRVLM